MGTCLRLSYSYLLYDWLFSTQAKKWSWAARPGKRCSGKEKNSYNLKTSVQLKKDYHFNYEIIGVKSCLIVVHLPKQNYTMFMHVLIHLYPHFNLPERKTYRQFSFLKLRWTIVTILSDLFSHVLQAVSRSSCLGGSTITETNNFRL